MRPCPQPAGAHRISRHPGDRRRAPLLEQRRHRGGGGRRADAGPRARHPGSGPGRGPQRRPRDRRPGARRAGLALGVLHQRARGARRHHHGLVRASAHQRPAGGCALRLERRAPDCARAHGCHGGAERRLCVGGHIAAPPRSGIAGGDPARALRSLRAKRRRAADRSCPVSQARLRAGQHRGPPVLRRVVRAVLSDAVHFRARLS